MVRELNTTAWYGTFESEE